ncbi:uncharacterized protein C8A04DRAFT_10998 [Dichotomopilus funicola]|uniref:Uncharacterized protein n=1 Tax=Dichotomopilus funicola TaxID=1934379 RepID=A0AAN6V4Z3_9PEZI|nr:hypothetical protein C8A04DRAFT_10998 [Dichotomopilus funicola]
MVSFFGLRVGGKKKKPETKPVEEEEQPHQRNVRADGQFLANNVTSPKGGIGGSLRVAPRAGTPQPVRSSTMPYDGKDSQSHAAASMFDLSSPGSTRSGSSAGGLKLHASEMNMRTRFGNNNGSVTSLVSPSSAGFGARFGANNGSSTSLASPKSGFGSRPGTSGGRAKPWVNPLDIHFANKASSGPPTPMSPLIDSVQLPPTPITDAAETGSVFGEEADDMVDAILASVKKREQEEKEAKKREKELEKQRETARLDMERLERQKSTESTLTARRPSAPHSPLELQQSFEDLGLPGPAFRRETNSRPTSRNGPPQSSCLHQGPPPTGPPTQCLPQPPGQGPPRQGPLGPAPRSGTPQLRSKGSCPGGLASGGPSYSQGPGSSGTPEKVFKPYRPPPLESSGALGPLPDALRSPSPPVNNSSAVRSQSPAIRSPGVQNPTSLEQRGALFNTGPEGPGSRRGTPKPENQGLGQPLISSLTSPSNVTTPAGSVRRLSVDDEPIGDLPRPVIKNVVAKRDTLAHSTHRQQSLSMRIEELEKTLLTAQVAAASSKKGRQSVMNRVSTGSSVYTDGVQSEDEDDDGPILSIQPTPLRIASPPIISSPPPAAPALSHSRPQSPMRGPPRRGPLPRRPGLEEYGVAGGRVGGSRDGTPTPGLRSASADNYSSHSSPVSRTNTPQLRQGISVGPGPGPAFKRDVSQPSPAPTLDTTFERPRPSPSINTGFNFDFGPAPSVIGPPTPDSTNWSLVSPAGNDGASHATASSIASAPPRGKTPPTEPSQSLSPTTKFTRANVPAPLNLKFNFSFDAPSRDPSLSLGSPVGSGPTTGMWTPPIRSMPSAPWTADGRPSTSGGPSTSAGGARKSGGLAASPTFLTPRFPDTDLPRERDRGDDDDPAAFMGIGMARGPSIRDVRRPKPAGNGGHYAGDGGRKTSGKGKAGMVDSFGTGFI